MLSLLGFATALLAVGSQALPTSQHSPSNSAINLFKRDTNSPTNRAAWDGTNDINTNWYTTWPNTGVVREVGPPKGE